MNAIGMGTFIIFMLAWCGGLLAWFLMIYHLFMFRLQHVRAKPTQHGWHTLRAGVIFAGFALLGLGAGVIGASLGNWEDGWPYGIHIFFV